MGERLDLSGIAIQYPSSLKKHVADLTGRLVGWLKVHPEFKVAGINNTQYWKCRCLCRQTCWVSRVDLQLKLKTHCGCKNTRKTGMKAGAKNVGAWYWNTARSGALSRGLCFKVSLEEIDALFDAQGRKCALTGVLLSPPLSSERKHTASLDRINSEKGYTIDNVQWVHKEINISKWDLPQEKFQCNCWLVARKFQEDLLKKVGWVPISESLLHASGFVSASPLQA